MKKLLLTFLALAGSLLAQSNFNVQKQMPGNLITGPLVFGSGISETFQSGSSLTINSGTTVSGLVVPTNSLIALGSLTPSSGALPYFTGTSTATTTPLSSFSGSLLGNSTAATWRTALAVPNPSAAYIIQTTDATLPSAFALSTLSTGLLKVTTTTGALTTAAAGTDYQAPSSNLTSFASLTVPGALTWAANTRQTFAPGSTVAGINAGSVTSDPSTPVNGDLWYNSTGNVLNARINGATVALGAGGGGGIGGSTGATSTAIITANGTGGSTIQASTATVDSSGNIFSPGGYVGRGYLSPGTATAVSFGVAAGSGIFQSYAGGNPNQLWIDGDHTIFRVGSTLTECARWSAAGNLLIGTTADTGLTGANGISVASTTDATSSTAASVIMAGGLGVAKKIISASTITGTQLISNIATGTAPFAVTSTTNVANLNASSLNGATFAAPGAIGSGTPGAGTFSSLAETNSLASAYLAAALNNTSSTGFVRLDFSVGAGGATGVASIKYLPGTFFQIGPDSNDTTTPVTVQVNNATQVATFTASAFTETGSIFSSSATAGLGYTTGSGGTVTQATSRTTGVTLNKVSGAITLVSAAGSATYQSFTVTNSVVAATDVPHVVEKSGTDKYIVLVTNVAAGSFQITFATTGGTTTEQPVFQFIVIKGSNS